MLKLNISDLQSSLQKSIKRSHKSLGLDIATRTGYAIILTKEKQLYLDYGFIKANVKDDFGKFDQYIEHFQQLIDNTYDTVVIEDSYFGGNALVLKLLAKLEGIAYTIAKTVGIKEIKMFGANTARKNIGAKGNAKKPEVAQFLKDNLNIDIEDNDIADAIVLAINGILL